MKRKQRVKRFPQVPKRCICRLRDWRERLMLMHHHFAALKWVECLLLLLWKSTYCWDTAAVTGRDISIHYYNGNEELQLKNNGKIGLGLLFCPIWQHMQHLTKKECHKLIKQPNTEALQNEEHRPAIITTVIAEPLLIKDIRLFRSHLRKNRLVPAWHLQNRRHLQRNFLCIEILLQIASVFQLFSRSTGTFSYVLSKCMLWKVIY